MQEILNTLNTLVTSPEWGLVVLFVLCFLSSTLLPLSSEPALLLYLGFYPEHFWLGISLASLGNTLGGILNFWIGARTLEHLEHRQVQYPGIEQQKKISQCLQTYGAPLLLLSWIPVIGDPMCLVAGFLKLPAFSSALYIATGKFLRYLILGLGFINLEPYWTSFYKALSHYF